MSGSERPARLGDRSTDQIEGESGGLQRRGPNGGFPLSTRGCGGGVNRDGCSASSGSSLWLHRRTPPRQAHPGLLLDGSSAALHGRSRLQSLFLPAAGFDGGEASARGKLLLTP